MPKYKVILNYDASMSVDIEAKDKDEAICKAERICEGMTDIDWKDKLKIHHTKTEVIEKDGKML